MPPSIEGIITRIESMLSGYYAFAPVTSACGFLLNDAGLDAVRKDQAIDPSDYSPTRGSVLFIDDGGEAGLFIGVHVADSVTNRLETANPLQTLDQENLDEFCLLVEEVSHFHLLLNRMTDQRNVTRLELEWQAEIDKLLISSMLLKEQYGNAHFFQLAKTLFDHALITSGKKELYETATRYAAKFWYGVARSAGWDQQSVRVFLQRNYHLNWDSKRSNLENLKSA